ncbi:hypothetical protein M231_00694 [Tremella mesenterica]|uniref:SEC7 domain-containing protein n=1 Tax=Tremella mesenterica TaxID=5217 RepID=A0A4Q1BV00_TREME|nr:hypothetical protein M231_00694 [Tremella mesenterica]
MDLQSNPDAGPSRCTPPTTPSNKPKRRSWFSLTPPVHLTTSSPTGSGISRRPSMAQEEEHEEHELAIVGHDAEGERVVESGPSVISVTEPVRTDMVSEDHGEMLNINGEPEKASKLKKKRKSKIDPDGEVLRLQDLPHKPPLPEPMPPPSAFTSRTFTRAASDRHPFPIPDSPWIPDYHPPRSSSLTHPTPTSTFPRRSFEKAHPPLPYDRPLPPLPPNKLSLDAVKGDENATPPPLPRGIVVTPSSPHKPTDFEVVKTQISGPSRRRSGSLARSNTPLASRSSPDKVQKSSPIGLGLPPAVHRRSSPEKDVNRVAVSSPLPNRNLSPGSRISSVDEGGRPSSSRDSSRERRDMKAQHVKRVRSMSGILRIDDAPNSSRISLAGHSHDGIPADTGERKSSRVLEWLGVRRTPRRPKSVGKLKADDTGEELQDRGRAGGPQSIGFNMDSHRLPSPVPSIANSSRTSSPVMMIRPGLPAAPSTTTVVPSPGGKLSALFHRRASAKQESSPAGTSTSELPNIITTPPLPHRNGTAMSSQSSLVLPPIQSVSSPINISHVISGAETPHVGSETEELLYAESLSRWGPGIRPWMDGLEGGQQSSSSSLHTPLEPLPESNPLDLASATAPRPSKETRPRAWSDAPAPSPDEIIFPALQPDLNHGSSNPTPVRPRLGARTNSNNSAIIDRMRNVFTRSSSRQRSQTVSRISGRDLDEFGVVRPGRLEDRTRVPSSSSSSMISPASIPGFHLDSPPLPVSNSDRLILLDEPLSRSPRNSFSASSPLATSVQPPSTAVSKRFARARASTVSSVGPSSASLLPPSPNIYPIAATPPRRRPSVIHRISTGLLGSSPKATGLFPLPPRSSGSASSTFTNGLPNNGSSVALSLTTSPRPSTSSVPGATAKHSVNVPAIEADESAQDWLARVMTTIGRVDIAGVLATRADPFHAEALRLYMGRFDFVHQPLDVALRMLLLQMSLPKETQQIDRVIEAFATRYEECEPLLFGKPDNTYVLAFSMLMLHTDHFNAHNKSKMTKADYVRNTRLEGVLPIVLEVFYDNITAEEFIFMDDDEVSRPTLNPGPGGRSRSNTLSGLSVNSSSTAMAQSKPSSIDVYGMINNAQLRNLEHEVRHHFPIEDHLSAMGTLPALHVERLHRAFIRAKIMPLPSPSKRKLSSKLNNSSRPTSPLTLAGQGTTMQVAKIARVLVRKHDSIDIAGKKARKWRPTIVVLTPSQMLLYKDSTPKVAPVEVVGGESVEVAFPSGQPEEMLSLKDALAVYDKRSKHHTGPYTFRFVMPLGRQYVIQLLQEGEMNEWIGLVNYASAFRTAGIRMRAAMTEKEPFSSATMPISRVSAEIGRDSERKIYGEPMQRGVSDSGQRLRSQMKGDDMEKIDDRNFSSNPNESHNPYLTTNTHALSLQAAQSARWQAIDEKIRALSEKADQVDSFIQTSFQLARNIAILTPFLKSSRDRLVAALPGLAHPLRQDRLESAKLRIWIIILRNHMAREKRESARLRSSVMDNMGIGLRDAKSPREVGMRSSRGDSSPMPSPSNSPLSQSGVSDLQVEYGEQEDISGVTTSKPTTSRVKSDEKDQDNHIRPDGNAQGNAMDDEDEDNEEGDNLDVSPDDRRNSEGESVVDPLHRSQSQTSIHSVESFHSIGLGEKDELGDRPGARRSKSEDVLRRGIEQMEIEMENGKRAEDHRVDTWVR